MFTMRIAKQQTAATSPGQKIDFTEEEASYTDSFSKSNGPNLSISIILP